MARLKGGLITSTFDVSKRGPLDSRELVTKYEDLINPAIWITNTTSIEALFNGLRVSVSEVGENMGTYFLVDRKAITEENYNNYLLAKESGTDTTQFFSMWSKLLTTSDDFVANLLAKVERNSKELDNLEEVSEKHSAVLAGIGNVENGEEPTIIAYINKTISGLNFELPEATKGRLGGVKIDDKTIKTNEDKQIYVAEVSTDILEQGLKVLVLNGGNDDLFN